MKHRINKLAAIFIVSVIGLAGASAGYALWYDELHLDIDVYTGSLSWIFEYPVTLADVFCPPDYYPTNFPDYLCDPNIGFYAPGSQPYIGDKNVGCGSAILVDDHHIQVTINNAYPGYYNHLDFWVECTGTIALVIDSLLIYDASGALIAVINSMGVTEFDITGDGYNDMQIKWGHPFGEPGAQLHPGDERDISFGFCFLQPLPQDATIVLYFSLLGIQYNEWVPPTI